MAFLLQPERLPLYHPETLNAHLSVNITVSVYSTKQIYHGVKCKYSHNAHLGGCRCLNLMYVFLPQS